MSNPSGNHANQYPSCNYWNYCLFLRPLSSSEGNANNNWNVTSGHLKKSCAVFVRGTVCQGVIWHLLKRITSKENRAQLSIMRRNSFLQAPIKVELISRTGRPVCFSMIQGRLVTAGYRSRHLDRCPRLTLSHHRRRMLAHKHHNWSHQHWYHVLFADESINLYKCNGHGRVYRRIVERQRNCCMQETDEIRDNIRHSGRRLTWTHHRIPHASSANGSSFEACLLTFGGGSDDQESVWGIASFWMSWAISSCYETPVERADKESVLSSPERLHPNAGRWVKTLSPHVPENDTVVFWCDRLQ